MKQAKQKQLDEKIFKMIKDGSPYKAYKKDQQDQIKNNLLNNQNPDQKRSILKKFQSLKSRVFQIQTQHGKFIQKGSQKKVSFILCDSGQKKDKMSLNKDKKINNNPNKRIIFEGYIPKQRQYDNLQSQFSKIQSSVDLMYKKSLKKDNFIKQLKTPINNFRISKNSTNQHRQIEKNIISSASYQNPQEYTLLSHSKRESYDLQSQRDKKYFVQQDRRGEMLIKITPKIKYIKYEQQPRQAQVIQQTLGASSVNKYSHRKINLLENYNNKVGQDKYSDKILKFEAQLSQSFNFQLSESRGLRKTYRNKSSQTLQLNRTQSVQLFQKASNSLIKSNLSDAGTINNPESHKKSKKVNIYSDAETLYSSKIVKNHSNANSLQLKRASLRQKFRYQMEVQLLKHKLIGQIQTNVKLKKKNV